MQAMQMHVSLFLFATWLLAGFVLIYRSQPHTIDHPSPSMHQPHNKHDNMINRMNIPHPSDRSSSTSSSYSNMIFFDWYYHSDALSYINYKSLESYLACCYTATSNIEIIILASHRANYYKIDSILSKATFMKYAKHGYRIDASVYWTASSLLSFTHSKNETRMSDGLGGSYYQRHLLSMLDDASNIKHAHASTSRMVLYMYARIARLYGKGGEYYDLTWLHQVKLASLHRIDRPLTHGVIIIPFCYNTSSPSHALLHASHHMMIHDSDDGDLRCASSTMMYFPMPKSPVLRCLLGAFDDDNSLLHACMKNNTRRWSHDYDDAICMKRAFERCFARSGIANDLDTSYIMDSVKYTDRRFLSSMMRLPPMNASYHAAAISSTPLLWLGADAVTGRWSLPPMPSHLHHHIVDNDAAVMKFSAAYADKMMIRYSNHTPPCAHYSALETSIYPDHIRQRISSSCALSFVLPGFMKAGSSYVFDILRHHPQVVTPLQGMIFKETGCYEAISLLSDRPDDRLQCFPFIQPHEPFIYGDGTVSYINQNLHTAEFLKRENPNIKSIILLRDPIDRLCSQHRFLYNVYQTQGLADINLLIDIVLSSSTSGGISFDNNDDVMHQMHKLAYDALHELQYDNGNNTALTKLLQVYDGFKNVAFSDDQHRRAATTVYKSIYFPAIFLWDRVLGEQHTYIIESERFHASRTSASLSSSLSSSSSMLEYTGMMMNRSVEDEFDRLFRFLGLYPHPVSLSSSYDHKSFASVPPYHRIASSSRARIKEFFQPFNDLLRIYLQHRSQTTLLTA